MKKLIASAGIAAVGAASLQAAPVGLSPTQTSKPWSISASLRGFYDDNITTVPNAIAEESFGIHVSPSVNFNVVREQTQLSLGYTFGLRWYENREPDSSDEIHEVSANLKHNFNPTLSLDVNETLRVAQEPTINNSLGTVIRGLQDYLQNDASIGITKGLNDRFSLYTSYANRYIDFDAPGFSSLLNRYEHTPLVHLLSQVSETTVGLIGYRFKAVRYTDDNLFVNGVATGVDPEVRNSNSHYIYAGVDHAFTPTLQGSARLGAQITNFNEAPAGADDNIVSPFADANLSYGYAEGSTIQFGVKHERNRNDLAYLTAAGVANPNALILDQEQTVLYAAINHQLTAKLMASLQGTYLNGSYEGGGPGVDGANDEYWALGINLAYTINQFLSAEAGYNFDDYESGVASAFRSYDRNRVYLGLRASY